jgi:hypothetical protein
MRKMKLYFDFLQILLMSVITVSHGVPELWGNPSKPSIGTRVHWCERKENVIINYWGVVIRHTRKQFMVQEVGIKKLHVETHRSIVTPDWENVMETTMVAKFSLNGWVVGDSYDGYHHLNLTIPSTAIDYY